MLNGLPLGVFFCHIFLLWLLIRGNCFALYVIIRLNLDLLISLSFSSLSSFCRVCRLSNLCWVSMVCSLCGLLRLVRCGCLMCLCQFKLSSFEQPLVFFLMLVPSESLFNILRMFGIYLVLIKHRCCVIFLRNIWFCFYIFLRDFRPLFNAHVKSIALGELH